MLASAKKCPTFDKIGDARNPRRREIGEVKARQWKLNPCRTRPARSNRAAPTTENQDIMKKLFMLSIAAMALAALTASAGDAKAIYEQSCAKCHGADGKGDTKIGQKLGVKDYSTAAVQDALKDDVAFKSIKEGLKGADGSNKMKPAEGISDDDIKALVAYMRTFKK
jgi:mono/diheme cytochrome c family protein